MKWKRRTKGICLLSATTLWLAAASVTQAQTQGPVVGFYRLQLKPGRLHLMAPPLSPQPLDSGRMTQLAPNQITDESAAWNADQWAGYEIIFASGMGTGWRYIVTGNSDKTLFVLPDPVEEQVASIGDRYEVLPNLEEYFAEQLRGDADAERADQLGVYDEESPNRSALTLYKDASGFWRDCKGGYEAVTVIAGQGFWLRLVGNLVASDATREIVLVGRLRTWPGGGVFIERGMQIVSVPLPSRVTLGSLDWTGAVAGATANQSDQIAISDSDTGQLSWAWLSTNGWQWVSSPSSPQSPSDRVLSPGEGYLYQHRGNGFFLNWSK